jgi:hypothetical protein
MAKSFVDGVVGEKFWVIWKEGLGKLARYPLRNRRERFDSDVMKMRGESSFGVGVWRHFLIFDVILNVWRN